MGDSAKKLIEQRHFWVTHEMGNLGPTLSCKDDPLAYEVKPGAFIVTGCTNWNAKPNSKHPPEKTVHEYGGGHHISLHIGCNANLYKGRARIGWIWPAAPRLAGGGLAAPPARKSVYTGVF